MKRFPKRIAFPFIAAVLALLLLAAGAELIAVGYAYIREGHYVSARSRFASRTNTFVQGIRTNRDCGYVDSLYLHPYLAFVHHRNPPCGDSTINNIGLWGADFASTHRSDRFVVLLTGGSVAAQFGEAVSDGGSYLERTLNERYVSPTGKPFLVLDGGDGAWKQPQQTILFLLYADTVDAVLTLDGFNEHYAVGSAARFEYPANNFMTVNPLVSSAFGDIVSQWLVGTVREWAARNPLLSRSQAAYAVIAFAQDSLARRAAAQPKPVTTVESLFQLPAAWSTTQRKAWAMEQYRKYIRAMQAIAGNHGVRTAFFVQPVPAIQKPLSPDEVRVVGDLGYRSDYLAMTDNLVELTKERIPVISLLDLLEGDTRTIYADPIHFVRGDGNISPGNERLAQRIAAELARLWNLPRR